MKSLRNKRILWIGTGDMGFPSLIELLKRKDVHCSDVTVVAGRKSGQTDKSAIYMALLEAGIPEKELDELNMISRDNVTPEMMNEMREENVIPHIVVFAIPPASLKPTLKYCRRVIKPQTEIISLVAGAQPSTYRELLNQKNPVSVIVPQIPKKLCAIFGKNKDSIETAKLVCSGLGDLIIPQINVDEKRQHALATIIGTYPALTAHYIMSYDKEEEQNRAIYWLKTFAAQESGTSTGAVDNIIKERCKKFYNCSLITSKHFLGAQMGTEILNKSLDASLDYTYQNKNSIEEFILKVRSEKGMANAALVILGSPPPETPKFGNIAELFAQKFYAKDYLPKTMKEEEKIPYAMVAATLRSKAMGKSPSDPLQGVDLGAISKEVRAINAGIGQQK